MLMLPSTALASDWAGFQKDNYNGGVTEDVAPITMPDSNSWVYNTGTSGLNTQPVIVDGVVYTSIYTYSGVSRFIAVNLETGDEIWSSPCPLENAISTPVYGDGMIFAATSHWPGPGEIYAFYASNGTEAWHATASEDLAINTPIIYEDNRLYFGEGWGSGGGKYYCYYSDTGKECWNRSSTSGGDYHCSGAALIGDYLVYGDGSGNLTSVQKGDGSTSDELNVSGLFGSDIGGIKSGVTYKEESQRIYGSSTGGFCFYVGFDPSTGTFKEDTKSCVNIESSSSTPALYNDRVYVGDKSKLYCFDAELSGEIWSYTANGNVASPISLSSHYNDGDGEVYIYFTTNCNQGSLYCLKDKSENTEAHEQFVYNGTHPQFTMGGASISEGWVVFGNNAGYIFGATSAEALSEASSSQAAEEPEVLFEGEITLSSGTFNIVPDNNLSASYEIDNFTDLGVLVAAADEEGFELNISDAWYAEYGSFLLNSINGIGDADHWWNLYINGDSVDVGLGGNQLEDGDKVSLYYVPLSGGIEDAEYVLNITLNTDTWYQFHKDAAHTGFAPGEAPDTNNLLWVSDSIYATPSSSPVIADGKVFVKCGVDNFLSLMPAAIEDNRIVVLNESTGEILSDYSGGNIEGSWSSPCYHEGDIWLGKSTGGVGGAMVADGKVFDSNSSEHRYYCTDIESGEELWTIKILGDAMGTPAYYDGMVYLTSGPTLGSPGYVYCVDAESGKDIWELEISSQAAGSAAVSNGVVYVAAYKGELYALDAYDGSVLWNKAVSSTDISSTPAIAYGNVYISGGADGISTVQTYCYNASTGEPVWSTSSENKIGGFSTSVAVADGKVFVGKHKEGNFFGHNTTYALDAYTGDVIWEAPYGGSSPAITDGIVFTIGADGKVYAFADSDSEPSLEIIFNETVNLEEGKLSYSPAANPSVIYRWDRMTDLGALIATGLEFKTADLNSGSFWTTSLNGIENQDYTLPDARLWSIFINGESAPSGLGGNALSDGDRVSFFYCPWEGMTPLTDQATYVVHITVKAIPSNAWCQFHKDAAHTGFSPGDAPDTNSLLWVSDPIGAVTSSSPVIASGKVFVNCGGGSCCCDKDTDTSSEGAKIVALDEFTGDSLFTCGSGSDRFGSWASPCYDEGNVWCGLPESVNGGTMVANGKVYVGNYDGNKYLCFDEESNEELWAFEVSGNAQCTPAFSDGKIFLTSGTFSGDGYVYCVDANSGAEKWNISLPQSAFGSPAVSNDIVYVTTFLFGEGEGNGKLYALYAEDGTEVWARPATIQASDSTPAIGYGNVYVAAGCPGSNPIQTYCFNATTGTPVWNTSVEGELGGWTVSVAVADHKVFVGKSNDGDMYGHYGLHALNSTTGESVWSTPYGGASPAIADGIVFTVGADGRVYAFANPEELDRDYSVPETDLPLDAEVLPAVSIEINSTGLDFGTLTPGESSSVSLSIKNSGKADIKLAPGLSPGSGQLFEDYLFFGSTALSDYSQAISSQETEDVEVVLNVPAGYEGDLGEAEGKLIFWVEAA